MMIGQGGQQKGTPNLKRHSTDTFLCPSVHLSGPVLDCPCHHAAACVAQHYHQAHAVVVHSRHDAPEDKVIHHIPGHPAIDPGTSTHTERLPCESSQLHSASDAHMRYSTWLLTWGRTDMFGDIFA